MVNDIAGSATYDKSRVHTPRLFWRQVPVDLHNVSSWAFEVELVGFPGPYSLNDSSPSVAYRSKNIESFTRLFDSNLEASEAWADMMDESSDPLNPGWELGRLRLAAFAFDTSVATLGAPLGRVPKRRDQ